MEIKKWLFYKKRFLLDPRIKPFALYLKQNQLLSKDELNSRNWFQRKQLVNFVYNNIPFYKKKYSEIGFHPSDLKTESDYSKLPVLEKEEIRKYTFQLINPQYKIKNLEESTTGGTTGIPLKTYIDPRYPLNIISWRTLSWWGVEPYDNSAYLYRAVPGGLKRILQKTVLYPTRRTFIAASEMTESKMTAFYQELVSIRPTLIVGYVGAIHIFAEFLQDKRYYFPKLKAVWTTASPLTKNQRSYMQKVFKCPVYSQYGSCEFYWIASECQKQNGMHIANDIRHIDIVDGNMPQEIGKFGDILVTDLINYAFPLIRYRIGDRGRLLNQECSCGVPFPMMDYVHGRITDTIRLPNGMAIAGEYWTTIFDNYTDTIKSFQVHQKDNYSIVIKFEPYNGEYENAIKMVGTELNKKLKNQIPINFIKMKLDCVTGGKSQFIISDIRDQ